MYVYVYQVSYLIHHVFMAHIFWYNENMEENQLNIIQRLKLSKNVQFDADADFYMTKILMLVM